MEYRWKNEQQQISDLVEPGVMVPRVMWQDFPFYRASENAHNKEFKNTTLLSWSLSCFTIFSVLSCKH